MNQKNPKGDKGINMKHRFLILLVAFLFCCTGCSAHKKVLRIKNQYIQSHAKVASAAHPLIKRSSQSIVQASCIKNKNEEDSCISDVQVNRVPKKYVVKDRIAEIEARLGDLPVPLMVQGVSVSDEGQGRYFIVYKTALSLDELTQFYGQEMERLGWQKVTSFEHAELLFSFKKQKRSCVISVRPSKRSWWNKKPTLLYVYLQI